MASYHLTSILFSHSAQEFTPRAMVSVLGPFGLMAAGVPTAIGRGSKSESLLSFLALAQEHRLPRGDLLDRLWPDSDQLLAGQSLNSLTYRLNKHASDEISLEALVLCEDGYYALNTQGGVGVDVDYFEAFSQEGERLLRSEGDIARGVACCQQAIALYRGDLAVDSGIATLILRERLRARFLNLLACVADFEYARGNFSDAMQAIQQMLSHDPCREDAHRNAMRCYVRLGMRAQALRQYSVCCRVLADEFDAVPEQQTTDLYDQVRLDPSSI